MATSLEELKILQIAESLADDTWKQVITWDAFAREVVGGQLARALDSIGANIAESFGRYHYGEKLQFLYYARGSLFEAKYWLNRSQQRHLISSDYLNNCQTRLTDLARQINAFAGSLKDQKHGHTASSKKKSLHESTATYSVAPYSAGTSETTAEPLFSDLELQWLQSPIPNL